MTLRSQLITFFKQEKYQVHSGNLERVLFKTRNGGHFKGASIGREARRLAEEGIIKVTYEKGCAVYQYELKPYERLHQEVKQGINIKVVNGQRVVSVTGGF